MAGHSKFKNIMHRKGAQDKKRAKLFARLIREISVATKLGLPDPNSNPRLRTAINNALSANMPKDNIDRAIKKNSESDSSTQIEEITYEGFGPGGVAIVIEAMTDNKNRTASEIRSTFNKYGGNLGSNGSVKHFFEKIGIISFSSKICSFDEIFEFSVSNHINDIEEVDGYYEIITKLENFHMALDSLEKKYGLPKASSLEWRSKEILKIQNDDALKLIKLIEKLEDCDDVQNIALNCNFSDEILENL